MTAYLPLLAVEPQPVSVLALAFVFGCFVLGLIILRRRK